MTASGTEPMEGPSFLPFVLQVLLAQWLKQASGNLGVEA
jgi:hypothetical protein